MPALELKGVSKVFHDGDQEILALKPTDFLVEKGEFVAIIGPSGSGKSTFLTIAGGLQQPSQGQVFVGQTEYSRLSEKQRAALRFDQIGFILQSSNLIPYLTVEQQLILVDKITKKEHRQVRHQLLDDLGLSHLMNKLPKEISGGERQRVAIARALYHDPEIILADEPTASLDSNRAYEVVSLLAQEAKKRQKAIVMVTHDLRMIEGCDRVYEMKDGLLSQKHL
ncbi:putative ABC transport system ATP-binding protein [Streptococcus rupicaprae]|uniref:Putative hemin import ATP-binding protein HrtA n=1 Tax=Streptococcus rupicaprae TaxID=759619 RepID=A0ABV2FKP7_9STRE